MLAELFYMDTTIWAKTPYIPNFVTKLKEQIPKDYRYWDKDEKVWVVNYSYEKELISLCEECFTDIAYYGDRRYTKKVIQSSPNYKTLFLLPSAPKEVVVAAYRVLSKLYHPDINHEPDAEKRMKEVNVAFDAIMGKR